MSSTYLYWLVRYVPDVVRGEQVNVAVIVGRDASDWAIRVAADLRRASRLGGDASGLRPWLDQLARTIHEFENPPLEMFAPSEEVRVSRAWLELLAHRFNNVLQVSEATPVIAQSARDGADFLFPLLVATPPSVTRSRTRARLIHDLGELYERTASLQTGGSLLRGPRAHVGRQRGRFDFAVVDDSVDQLSNAFAFDVRDTDVLERELQSWNFIVSRLRDEGASISQGRRSLRARSDVPVAVAFQEPARSDTRVFDVFEAALEAWSGLGVNAVPSTQLDAIARDARDLVTS